MYYVTAESGGVGGGVGQFAYYLDSSPTDGSFCLQDTPVSTHNRSFRVESFQTINCTESENQTTTTQNTP